MLSSQLKGFSGWCSEKTQLVAQAGFVLEGLIAGWCVISAFRRRQSYRGAMRRALCDARQRWQWI